MSLSLRNESWYFPLVLIQQKQEGNVYRVSIVSRHKKHPQEKEKVPTKPEAYYNQQVVEQMKRRICPMMKDKRWWDILIYEMSYIDVQLNYYFLRLM